MDKKLVWLVVAALLTGGVVAQAGYTFTLDGREEVLAREGLRVRGGIVSLRGDSERPVAGDLAWISARATCLVRLEAPGRYEFTDEFEAAGRLLLRHDQGSRVAVVDSTRLVAADAATRAALLGVVVDRWDAEVADALAKLAPTVPLVVTDGAAIGAERALPELPAGIEHLALAYETKEGFGDLEAARRLANLRSLYLGGQYCGFTEVDLRPFANATRLLVFACDQSDLKGAEVVENFRELRSFAGFDFPMTSFASLQRATELRSLYAWGPGSDESAPRSLVPLADLPRLERLTLLFTPIGELPANGFPSLRVLYLQGCGLPAAQQRAFRKAHPECKVDGAVDGEQLQATLAIADRVVLRTGGTCHRVVARERVLFETGDAAEIARLLPLLQVVEDGEGFHCGCCGGPTLVFSAAGREVASLGVHHGVALRWAEGPWNSDAALTREAAAGLEQWLVDHGDVATRRERDAARARAEAEERRASLRAAVFGETVAPRADREELAADWLRRAAACKDDGLTQLRLLGCHEGAWDQQDEFDQALVTAATETLMATGDWSAVLAGGKADARCALGLAAVLVEQPADPAAAERMAAAFAVAVPAALRSPQPWNRARMLQWLRDDPSPASLEWLLAALDGQFEPRQVPPVELVAPGGMVRIHPSDPVLDAAGSSTPVLAAMCLAVRRHVAALPRLRALLLAASPRDAKRLQAAIAQLEAVK